MTDSIRDVPRDDDVGEALDGLLLDALLDAQPCRLRLPVHLAVFALQHRHADAQTYGDRQRG